MTSQVPTSSAVVHGRSTSFSSCATAGRAARAAKTTRARKRRRGRARVTSRAWRGTRGRPGTVPTELSSALGEVLGADQYLARLGAVARADDPVLLHHVDETRGLRVAQAHAALQERDRRLALADDEVHGVPVEVVALGGLRLRRLPLGGEHDLLVHRGA